MVNELVDSVYELIERELGAKVTYRVNPEVAQIGTSATQFLKQNPRRVAFVLSVLGAYDVYIHTDQSVTSSNGILVGKSGGSSSTNWKEDFILPALNWYGIASSASNCYVLTIELTP